MANEIAAEQAATTDSTPSTNPEPPLPVKDKATEMKERNDALETEIVREEQLLARSQIAGKADAGSKQVTEDEARASKVEEQSKEFLARMY